MRIASTVDRNFIYEDNKNYNKMLKLKLMSKILKFTDFCLTSSQSFNAFIVNASQRSSVECLQLIQNEKNVKMWKCKFITFE